MDNTYLTLQYNSKSRWLSYWYQISEALEVSPDSVLVIGKGSGITENVINHLTNYKTKVLTLDINNALNSDIVGSIASLPFMKDAFDVAICCQVLEHVPFDQFPVAMSELHRVATKRVILSLPHSGTHLKVACSLPLCGDKSLIIKNPIIKKERADRQHTWEIAKNISRKQIIQQLSRLFNIQKEFLNEVGCDHRFFVLKRRKLV